MSASHRSIARLSLEIFTDLRPNQQDDPESLRSKIVAKLQQVPTRSGTPITITVGSLLQLSSPALLRALDPILCHEECQELIRRICHHCAPSPSTALDLLHGTLSSSSRRYYLPTGMPSLNVCLKGGFAVGTISELVGRAGVGKSQLALQLCILAAKYNQATIYIDTEKKLSLARLEEMANERCASSCSPQQRRESSNSSMDTFSYGTSVLPSTTQRDLDSVCDFYGLYAETNFPYKTARQVLANVLVHTADSTHELLNIVSNLEDEILFRNQQVETNNDDDIYPVRLLILDSIAAPTRRDFGAESAPQRVSAVLQLAQVLKRLAHQLQLVVIVINQVGINDNDSIPDSIVPTTQRQGSDLVAVHAALGTAWTHCLSTRLLLQHERDPHCLHNTVMEDAHENISPNNAAHVAWKEARGRIRKATVVKSNVAGMESMHYEISISGLEEICFANEE